MSADAARLETVDWEALEGRSVELTARTASFVASVAGLAGLFVYDYAIHQNYGPPIPGLWDIERHDWLLLLALVAFVHAVVWPLVADRDRTRTLWRRFRENPFAVAALGVVAAFVLTGTVGPFLISSGRASLWNQYQPPMGFTSPAGVTSPCVGPMVDGWCHGSLQFPLGTDMSGISVVELVVGGARISLLVALVAALAIAPLATAVGVASGYLGGWVDEVLMRYVDVQDALPAFIVYIFLSVAVGESLWLLLVVFGVLSWGGIARLVRSEVLQRKEEGYVKAARSAGASRLYVARRHLLPNVSATSLTATTQLVPTLILTEAAVSFMRLTDPMLPSWGEILSQGLSDRYASFPPVSRILPIGFEPTFWQKWWVAGFTTAALVLTVVAFAVLGDALRDVLDPRSKA